jgi:dihydroorotate dehydrogenase electron transfer subunit
MKVERACLATALTQRRHSGENCFSLFFEGTLPAKPGQFAMVWIPGLDEIPMSLSHIQGNEIGITVKVVGEATEALCSLKKGDRVRIRGPFGRGFDLNGKNPIIVAGGVGAAPLLPLAKGLAGEIARPTIVIGAKTKKELVLIDEFKDLGLDTLISSDDGSIGYHGTASGLLSETLADRADFDAIYCCGPEPMIESVARTAEKWSIWGQAALERLMKCGIGICGSCAVNEKLVCRDGPVFDFAELRQLPEFGRIKRDAAGRPRPRLE